MSAMNECRRKMTGELAKLSALGVVHKRHLQNIPVSYPTFPHHHIWPRVAYPSPADVRIYGLCCV